MTRREELADAAIATLARDGMRGLTHRAVDREAGLPEGSTSYYFRTRQALLQAVVERATEVDAAEIPRRPAESLDSFAEATTGVVETWVTTGWQRQLARFELALEATRRPEMREVLVVRRDIFREMVTEQFDVLGIPDSRRRAASFVDLLNGLLFTAIAGAGKGELAGPALRAEIRSLLNAVTSAES